MKIRNKIILKLIYIAVFFVTHLAFTQTQDYVFLLDGLHRIGTDPEKYTDDSNYLISKKIDINKYDLTFKIGNDRYSGIGSVEAPSSKCTCYNLKISEFKKNNQPLENPEPLQYEYSELTSYGTKVSDLSLDVKDGDLSRVISLDDYVLAVRSIGSGRRNIYGKNQLELLKFLFGDSWTDDMEPVGIYKNTDTEFNSAVMSEDYRKHVQIWENRIFARMRSRDIFINKGLPFIIAVKWPNFLANNAFIILAPEKP